MARDPYPETETKRELQHTFALVGLFETPAQLYHACEAVRDAGYEHFDAHTPFPVHGLENAMGLPPSKLPWIVLGAGMTGFASAVLMQWWMLAIDYPQNISGKPFFAYQAYVPITFELTVLFSAFACFFGMWGLNLLPRWNHPVFSHKSWPRATDDAFLLSIEVRDPKFDSVETKRLLESLGAKEIEEVLS